MSPRSTKRTRGSVPGKRAAPKPSPFQPGMLSDITGYLPRTGWLRACLGVLTVASVALLLCATGLAPGWLDGPAAVAVVTCLSWLLASRTAGRAFISALVAFLLASTTVVIGGDLLPAGAALLTCVIGGTYAVMATVPAVTFTAAVKEVLIATGISAVTALGAVGFEPAVNIERFDIVSVLVALALSVALVYRLGAGLHGLGRRGLIVVAASLGVLVSAVAYVEVLRRFGAPGVVTSVLDFVEASKRTVGAFPRPLVAFLGIPALMCGVHLRARRRQGWWVCTFGVAATVPMAAGLVGADSSYLGAALRAGYSLILGLITGYLVIRADLALTGSRGARARRAEEAEAVRPEPGRFNEL